MNYFDSTQYLEPRCEKCGIVLDYGTNTEFNEKLMSQVCMVCGNKL
ncbi:TPA: hypothetical protein HA239_05475 [Candidatus Woesearchaeota archaeon]|nr:hypothetical protein QT06_C0001G1274 [archaeon GW2011_AR15]MBS3104267.1 hypothetical protein [Candidatus Woesearchaeota archaeon]HIH41832.1 hypothetical protein [Candidatus Woesearchaeota archaeon]